MDSQHREFLRTQLSNINVLYVEDDEEARFSTVRLLESFFSNIITANNGKEGLEIFSQYNTDFNNKQIDLIITDIDMPQLDGLDMVKSIKSINSRIPVIVVSAHEKTEYFLHSIDIGIDGYVIKPLNVNELFRHILKITQKYFLNDYIYLQHDYVWDRLKKVLYKDNTQVKLTKNEMKLIDLMVDREHVISSDSIEYYIFDDMEFSNKRVRNLISRLHSKLDDYIIESVYGLGYKIKLKEV